MNRCTVCGDKYPDSSPYPACTQVCGAQLSAILVASLKAQGVDFHDVIPKAYPGTQDPRPDLIPWGEWQAAQESAKRLSGHLYRKPRWGT